MWNFFSNIGYKLHHNPEICMPRFIFLFLFISATLLPDVIIRPREPEEKRYFLDFSAVDSFPGKIFLLSNLFREYYTSADEITNLFDQRYIQIKKNSAKPVIYVFNRDSLGSDFILTGEELSTVLSRLKKSGISYRKTDLDISKVFKKKYGSFDEVYFTVSFTMLKDSSFKAAITAVKIYEDSELIKEMPFKPEAGLFHSENLLLGDVAPEPEGLFAGDIFYFLLPLAGVTALLIILIRRRRAKKNV